MKDERVRCIVCGKKKQECFTLVVRFHPKAPSVRFCNTCVESGKIQVQFSSVNDRFDNPVLRALGGGFERVDSEHWKDYHLNNNNKGM